MRIQVDETTALSLLNAVWGNSPEGWQRLVELYSPAVYRSCRMAGLSPDDSADIGQEVFEAVSRNITAFRREEEGQSFRAWLHTITRNKIIDHFRRCSRDPAISSERLEKQVPTVFPPENGSELSKASVPQEIQDAISVVSSEFASSSWKAFWLTAVEGRKASEVAETLGITPNAVYLSRSRILRRLRQELDLNSSHSCMKD